MTIHMQDDTQAHFITGLKEELQVIINRERYQLNQSELRQMGASFLLDINNKFSNQNELIKNIAVKWNSFLDSWKQMRQDYEEQIAELNDELQYKSMSMDNLQEVLNHLEKKIKAHEQQYQKLKHQYTKVNDRLQNQEKEFKYQKNGLINSLKDIEWQQENDKNLISKMSNQKQILFDQIKHERSINKQQLQQIENLRSLLEINQKTIKNDEQKWNDLNRYNISLEETLEEKMEFIKRLQNEIKTYKNSCQTENIASLDTYLQNDIEFQSQFGQSMKKNIRLEDDMPFNENFTSYESQFSSMQRQHNGEPLSPIRKMNLDPYFSHFILTSQSVKIKEDCEQLLNIDIKPYYKQIIEKRIPMHLWDQWIRNRLRQLLKKIKATSMEDDDEQ